MKKGVLFTTVALVTVFGVGGYALVSRSKGAEDPSKKVPTHTVALGDLRVSVVETGSVDAVKVVDVKSRVTGRLARLLVDEGDVILPGQLIAVIDPKETQFRVEQDSAQLRGAQSGAARSSIEIEQRRDTARAAYEQARARLAQLALETRAQPRLTSAGITQAQAALDGARRDYDRLVKSIHPTQRTTSESAVREAQANHANAEREYQRQADLAQKGYVAGRAVDTAKLALDLAVVRLDNARQSNDRLEAQLRAEADKASDQVRQAAAELDRAQANGMQVGIKRQEYRSAAAEVEKARAALRDPEVLAKQRDQNLATVAQLSSVLRDSQRQLGETEIRAPIGGVVTKKGLQVGELATGLSTFGSGSTIVKIEDRKAMRVKLDMNEIDMAKLEVGMPARIDVDAIPNRTYNGVVRRIAPASKESGTGQGGAGSNDAVVKYEVEISVTDADRKLRSGMSAKCSVDVLRRTKVVVLPVEFLVKEGRRAFVEIAGKAPSRREIVLGAQTGALAEVISGLRQGDVVQRPKFNGPERKGFMQAGPDGE